MTTLADDFFNKGMEEGMAQGIVQGMAQGIVQGNEEGKAESLIRLLGQRFGPLSPEVEARIKQASPDELDGWLDQVLDAPSLEAMFGDITRH